MTSRNRRSRVVRLFDKCLCCVQIFDYVDRVSLSRLTFTGCSERLWKLEVFLLWNYVSLENDYWSIFEN